LRDGRARVIIGGVSDGAANDGLERRSGAPRRLVVLGTGTDVGKTYVAARLCEALRARGTRVLGLKPIESGFTDERAGDAAALRAAAGLGARPLYAFVEPIGPHLAARRANTVIELERVLSYVEEQERRSGPAVCVIETAGGAFSPLGERLTNADLAAALRPDAVILVAPDRLGVLHDVGATLRALGALRVDLLVISETEARDASAGTNRAEIEAVVLPQLGLRTPCVTCARGGNAPWEEVWQLFIS